MNTKSAEYINQDDDDMFPTVFTVPINRPFIVTREEYNEMLKNAPKPPSTIKEFDERRAEARKRADRWRKPEKKIK